MAGSHCFITLLILLLLINSSSSHTHDECRESSCGPDQPIIRFPFQLAKDSQDQCVNPAFCLYCTQNNNTMIVLSTISGAIQFFVTEINYIFETISISDPDNCLPKKFLELKPNRTSFLPYRFYIESENTLAFFNCSSVGKRHLRNENQIFENSQDITSCPIFDSYIDESVLKLDLVSCTKMFEVKYSINPNRLSDNRLMLSWPKPNCTECEANSKECRWKNNSTKGEIECFDCKGKRKTIHIPKYIIFPAIGSIILGLVIIAFTKIYQHFREKKEDQE
ncbi:hypothetical protein P8452_06566 [Trifolium repens]|nr:hypothetical protein P8452_06566 [Trifolium repens]